MGRPCFSQDLIDECFERFPELLVDEIDTFIVTDNENQQLEVEGMIVVSPPECPSERPVLEQFYDGVKDSVKLDDIIRWKGAVSDYCFPPFLENDRRCQFGEGDDDDANCYWLVIDRQKEDLASRLVSSWDRPVFAVDAEDGGQREWWEPLFQPWVHYVPVSRDFSDLLSNLDRIQHDEDLRMDITKASRTFAKQYLTRNASVVKWRDVIRSVADRQANMTRQKKIPALTVVTNNEYYELFEQWIRTLPTCFEPIVVQVDVTTQKSWNRYGFQAKSWYDIIRKKVEFFVEYLTAQEDGIIVMCSDSDIMFLNGTSSTLLRDLATEAFRADPELDAYTMMEPDGKTVNGGFYLVRNNWKTREFLARAANSCLKKTALADQDFINSEINDCLKWRAIPAQYVICGDHFSSVSCPLLHHAIGCFNVSEKLIQQELIRTHVAQNITLVPLAGNVRKRCCSSATGKR